MVKKTSKICNSKWFCTQNILIFFVGFMGVLVGYLYYIVLSKNTVRSSESVNGLPAQMNVEMPAQMNVDTDPRIKLSNPYSPPLKNDAILLSNVLTGHGKPSTATSAIVSSTTTSEIGIGRRGLAVPVNVNTSVIDTPYTQMGILTKQNGQNAEPVILPLMGRSLWNGRDKWMYYTMTNSAGSINTRLTIRVNGKSGTNEYGCDMISTGDTIYVDGYNDTFRATIYENAVLRYLPVV